MSKETLDWLNANTLIGFTSKRGTAWHYRADLQSSEPNHYPGPVPVEAVRRRLFHWDPESWEVYTRKPGLASLDAAELLAQPDDDAVLGYVLKSLGLHREENRQAITRPDTGHTMGIFTEGYQPHPYDEWLLTSVANILDDDLHIGSAGLLRCRDRVYVATRRPIWPLFGQFPRSWPFAVIALVRPGAARRSRVPGPATVRGLPLSVERRPAAGTRFPRIAALRRELRQARGLPAEREHLVGRLSD